MGYFDFVHWNSSDWKKWSESLYDDLAHPKPDIIRSTDTATEFFRDPSGWLYSDWSKAKYEAYLQLDAIYPIHLYMDYLLSKRNTEEYLHNNGMDYDDIHDPRKLQQTSAARALNGYALNFVSKNVERLYR